MAIWRSEITLTASSTHTVNFGRPYSNVAFYTLSGTGSGAIKLKITGVNGKNFVPISPNRIALAAGTAAQKVVDAPMNGLLLHSSGTANTAVVYVNAWGHP